MAHEDPEEKPHEPGGEAGQGENERAFEQEMFSGHRYLAGGSPGRGFFIMYICRNTLTERKRGDILLLEILVKE